MKIKLLLFSVIFGLFTANTAFSQQTNILDEIVNSYLKELKLNGDLEAKFRAVILDFSPQLKEKNLTTSDYNALMKKETLKIYEILNKEQFTIYKKLKESIEPHKKYRIETN